MKKIYIEKAQLKVIYNKLRNQRKVAEHFNVSLKVIKRLCNEYNLTTFEHLRRINYSRDKSFKKFCDVIRPYIPPSMEYKLIELKCND